MMKCPLLFFFFAALLIVFSSPLFANPTIIRENLWRQMLLKWDADKDGMLSALEWQGRIDFVDLDRDGDGFISHSEFIDFDPTQINACPGSCTSDADCASCPDGRTDCVDGQCVKAAPA
ncbi:MAG: hypothetical protein JW795_23650, partial [Chitinivibrionales bacterium]|nr:hypothetical protein [Chitinivibrionales bacterium]